MKYFETSAKTDVGVKELMEHIFEQILAEKRKDVSPQDQVQQSLPQDDSFTLKAHRHSLVGNQHQKEEKRKKGCC